MVTKAPRSFRFPAIVGLLAALLAHLAVLALPAAPLRAESDLQAEETDETINRAVKNQQNKAREAAKAQDNLKSLQQQHNELEFRKRTVDPFRSKRALRNDLRTNEAQQGWQQREADRLDFQNRMQQQNINNQIEAWRRK